MQNTTYRSKNDHSNINDDQTTTMTNSNSITSRHSRVRHSRVSRAQGSSQGLTQTEIIEEDENIMQPNAFVE